MTDFPEVDEIKESRMELTHRKDWNGSYSLVQYITDKNDMIFSWEWGTFSDREAWDKHVAQVNKLWDQTTNKQE
jgi:hypothetical protein